MRSAVANKEVSTDDSVGHDDDNGNAQKRHFRCRHSPSPTTGATEVKFLRAQLLQEESNKRTYRWYLSHRQQNEARALKPGLTYAARKPTRTLSHPALTIQRNNEEARRRPDLGSFRSRG